MRLFQVPVCFALLSLLSACASGQDRAVNLTQQQHWHWQALPASPFTIAAAVPPVLHAPQTLWVYLEGDGRAYVSPTQPSLDPTPVDPLALRLALQHPEAQQAVYLARPCQYPDIAARRGACDNRYWTHARYAPEIVTSLSTAISALKRQSGAKDIGLVGYSGGGALAVLIAAQRSDIRQIVTVAADLDTTYWTTRDQMEPLSGSLNPADKASATANIPQWHLTGGKDDTVGSDVVSAYMRRLPADNAATQQEIPNYDHDCCWAHNWSALISQRLSR